LPESERTKLRFAMLSVYYHAAGRRLELRGAPAVLLPPEVRPLPLGSALEALAHYPDLQRESVWRVIRSIPVRNSDDVHLYPPELQEYLPGPLPKLIDLRREFRRGASMFAAALAACRDQAWGELKDLERLVEKSTSSSTCFSSASDLLLGEPAADVLRKLRKDSRGTLIGRLLPSSRGRRPDEPTSPDKQLKRLENDVGLGLHDFVEDMADAAACYQFSIGMHGDRPSAQPTVFPVSSLIQQDSQTLTTTSTVTTLVSSAFEPLNEAIDPQSWCWSTHIIESAKYVRGPFDTRPLEHPPPVGQGCPEPLYLDESVVVSWGQNSQQQGRFRNILTVKHTVRREPTPSIELQFSLARSVNSRVLWDARAGGIQIDHGFIKVRALGQNRWRVTRRKALRFSDRTPYANARGWMDLGQMLNYLAPTALTWWLESELYSLRDGPPPQVSARSGQVTRTEPHSQEG
jgi:hypothetical protein